MKVVKHQSIKQQRKKIYLDLGKAAAKDNESLINALEAAPGQISNVKEMTQKTLKIFGSYRTTIELKASVKKIGSSYVGDMKCRKTATACSRRARGNSNLKINTDRINAHWHC